ncbi:MAG TPA: hypothetical protein VKZ84_04445 [Bacteriovoracaceae bacterium]|nr:hypothetical protein [Bacteriovoracaceae bacterium]
MKQKNPLYLVKGKTVHPTHTVWEYVIEKFNLRPVINILFQLISFILEQVKDYPSFVFARNFIENIIEKLQGMRARFS